MWRTSAQDFPLASAILPSSSSPAGREDFVAIISDNAAQYPLEVFRLGRDGKISVIAR